MVKVSTGWLLVVAPAPCLPAPGLPAPIPGGVVLAVVEDPLGPLLLCKGDLFEGMSGDGGRCGQEGGLHAVTPFIGDKAELGGGTVRESEAGKKGKLVLNYRDDI